MCIINIQTINDFHIKELEPIIAIVLSALIDKCFKIQAPEMRSRFEIQVIDQIWLIHGECLEEAVKPETAAERTFE